jgi:large subunit ribosomal protein L9
VPIEVLLRKTVESVGRVGEVVRVRPGYARNYLLPEGIAVLPTKENLRLVEKDKVVEEAAEAERAKERAALVAKIEGQTVTIEAKANSDGHLFGSVGAKQIADALAAKGFPVEERHVRMEPVKQTGESEVKVHLGPDAEATVKLWVVEELTEEMKAGSSAAPSTPAPAPASPPAPPRAPKRS